MGEVAVGSDIGSAAQGGHFARSTGCHKLEPYGAMPTRTGLRVGKIAGKRAACAATDARDFAHPTS